MSTSEKKFSLPEIIILVMIAVINDICDILAFIAFAAFAITGVGIAILLAQKFIDLVISGIITLWFWIKAGGKAGGLQIGGGVAEFFGLPFASAITVIIGIWLVNRQAAAAEKSTSLPGVSSVISKVTQAAEMV